MVHPGRLDCIEDPVNEAWERLLEWITDMDELAFRLGLRVGLDLMEKLLLEILTLPISATTPPTRFTFSWEKDV